LGPPDNPQVKRGNDCGFARFRSCDDPRGSTEAAGAKVLVRTTAFGGAPERARSGGVGGAICLEVVSCQTVV